MRSLICKARAQLRPFNLTITHPAQPRLFHPYAMSSTSPTSEQSSHSDPIPINPPPSHRYRPRSASETSDDSVPSLSPSQSPASAASVNVQTPQSSTSRIPLAPVSPPSPILSYFYGSPTKSAFARTAPPNMTFEGQSCPLVEYDRLIFRLADEESQEPSPTSASHHGRRMSTSWIPVRFAQQQQQQNTPAVETQQDRGAGLLRRLSISNTLSSKVGAVRPCAVCIYAYFRRFSRPSPSAVRTRPNKTEARDLAQNPVLELQGSSARLPLCRLELSMLTTNLVRHLPWGSACSRVTTTAFRLPSV